MDSWDDVDLQADIRRLARTRKKQSANLARVRKKAVVAAARLPRHILQYRGTKTRDFRCVWHTLRMTVHKQITVGTECSGLDSIMVAMDSLGLAGHCRVAFCCEKDQTARRFLRAVRQPEQMYDDITTRPVNAMPSCDLYAVGFPCQPWSSQGLNEGKEDKLGRGVIFDHMLEYIQRKKPRTFLLENVKGLISKIHLPAFSQMLDALRCDGAYLVSWQLLNTANHGIPQNRERVYIVGVLASLVPSDYDFQWPSPTECKPLVQFLEPPGVARTQISNGTVAHRNKEALLRQLTAAQTNWRSEPYMLDVFAPTPRHMKNMTPCITRSRGAAMGYWVSCRNGLMTVKELLRLQALPPSFRKLGQDLRISDRQMGMMIGNAMSVNVLVFLLHELVSLIDSRTS